MSAADAAIQKKMYGPRTIALIISDEEMEDVMKIIKSFEESGLLIKGISETSKDEPKEKQGEALISLILGTLAANMLGRALTRKRLIRAGEGTTTAGENF